MSGLDSHVCVSSASLLSSIPCYCFSSWARLSSSPLSIVIHKVSSIYLPLLSSYRLLLVLLA